MSINDKIKQVLLAKNLSPSYLADDIGVQRSSISHILSGRNRPSLDIIQKIVRRFPEFSYEWFLDDDIQLSTDEPAFPVAGSDSHRVDQRFSLAKPPSALSATDQSRQPASTNGTNIPKQKSAFLSSPASPPPTPTHDLPTASPSTKQVDRILIFYTDGTFREFMPA